MSIPICPNCKNPISSSGDSVFWMGYCGHCGFQDTRWDAISGMREVHYRGPKGGPLEAIDIQGNPIPDFLQTGIYCDMIQYVGDRTGEVVLKCQCKDCSKVYQIPVGDLTQKELEEAISEAKKKKHP